MLLGCGGGGWGGAGSRGKITLRSAFMNEGWGARGAGESREGPGGGGVEQRLEN